MDTEFIADAPLELGLVSFYASFPDEKEVPPQIRNRQLIILFGMYTGEREGAEDIAGAIVNHPRALADLGGWMSYPEAQSALDEEYPDGHRYYWKSLYLNEINDEILEIIDQYGHDRPTPETTLDIWTMGGAVLQTPAASSAFPQRHAKYMFTIESNWVEPEDDRRCIRWARKVNSATLEERDRSLHVGLKRYILMM